MKVYPLSSTIDALKQENCPNNLADMDTLSDLMKTKRSYKSILKSNHREPNDFDEYSFDHHSSSKGHAHRFGTESDMFENDSQFDFEELKKSESLKQPHGSNHNHRSTRRGQSNRHDQYVVKDDRNKHLPGDFSGHFERLHQSEFHDGSFRAKSGEFNHSDESDLLNQSNVNYIRIPRRGDIGIQSLDERSESNKGCIRLTIKFASFAISSSFQFFKI